MSEPHSRPLAPWWAGAVIYQIYPRSFADGNADGVGDIPGLIERLDHLAGAEDSLGVDAVWLSPIYPSPQRDFGYDISDFADVAPEFGTLADLDRLVAACHQRGLRLLLDLIPSHTSDQHPWFVESRSSRDAARREWYWWADPGPDGGPPSNWLASFGGTAWELDNQTGQYYLHSFYPEQPDLNWRSPAVADAIGDVMRFWLARGVDGFRVDAIIHVAKDAALRDNPRAAPRSWPFPPDRTGQEQLWTVDLPETLDVVRHLRRVSDEFDGRLLVGEAYVPVERLADYLGGEAADGFQRTFDFEMILIKWQAEAFRRIIERAERHTPAWAEPTWVLSNHDLPRHATRFGERRARLAAMVLLTLRGTICIYYGEEIGMVDSPVGRSGRYDRFGRDSCRTPMQWDASRAGGFSDGKPWLPPVDPAERNVRDQAADPASLLAWYRRLIRLRRETPALRHGALDVPHSQHPDVLTFIRTAEGESPLLVLANFADEPVHLPLDSFPPLRRVLAATGDARDAPPGEGLELAALEGLVLELEATPSPTSVL